MADRVGHSDETNETPRMHVVGVIEEALKDRPWITVEAEEYGSATILYVTVRKGGKDYDLEVRVLDD